MCIAEMPTLGCRRSHLPPVRIVNGERGRSKSDVEQRKKKKKKDKTMTYRFFFFLNLSSFIFVFSWFLQALNLVSLRRTEISHI